MKKLGTIPWRIAKVLTDFERESAVCEVNSRNFNVLYVCEELGTVSWKTAKVLKISDFTEKIAKDRGI